jgi:hypothetical protein
VFVLAGARHFLLLLMSALAFFLKGSVVAPAIYAIF